MPRGRDSVSRSPSPQPRLGQLTREEREELEEMHNGFLDGMNPGKRARYDLWLGTQTPPPRDGDEFPPNNPSDLDPRDPKYISKVKTFMVRHERLGVEISDDLKDTARALLEKGMDGKYLSEIKKKWARPTNMDCLKIPQLNLILKKVLKGEFGEHQKNDDKMVKIMELLVSVIACNMSTLDFAVKLLGEKCGPMEPVVESLNEAVAFGVKVFSDLIEARRSFLTSDLNSDFKEVLGDRNPANTEWLAGDPTQLSTCIEDIKKDDKQAELLRKHPKKKENAPGRGRGRGRGFDGQFSYPGHRGGYSPRGYGYNNQGSPYPTPFPRGGQQGPRFQGPGHQSQGGRGYGQSQNYNNNSNSGNQGQSNNNNFRGKGK